METLWPQIERILPGVSKPARYIGGEQGSVYPEHGPGTVAWLLLYPDTYEIGLPNQGLQILYEILDERPTRWPSGPTRPGSTWRPPCGSRGCPLFSVEQHLPAEAFDVLAFNLSAELVYTNLLNMIDLAGLPLHGADRGGADALVVAGGHCVYNPEPLADFVDASSSATARRSSGRSTRSMADWLAARRPRGARPCRAVARAGGAGGGVRPGALCRRLRRRAAGVHAAPSSGRARRGDQADGERPGRLALPVPAARAADRGGPRPAQRRGVPGLHAGMPLLPGRA